MPTFVKMKCFYISIVIVTCLTTTVHTASYSDILSVYNDIMNGYNKDLRPQVDQSLATNLSVDMSLLTLLDINEVDGSMTISGQFRFMWMAGNIGWSPGSYNGASLLTIPYDKIWRPPIANSNAAGSAKLFGTANSYLTVYSTGQIMWGSGETLKFLCDIDTSYYPFDTQKCTINIVTCGYQEGEIMFNLIDTPVKTTMFSENSEWELIHTSASVDNSGMASVSFHFHFKRRPLFLLTTLILPAIFLTMLNLLAFIMPHESGERLGFAMTLLLSIVVFLTIAQGLLPATAEPRLSAICIMLMATIIMSGMIVVSVIIGIIINDKKDEEEIPRWISKVVKFDLCRKQRPNSVSVAELQDKKKMKSDDDDDEDEEVTWKKVEIFWDRLSLYFFSFCFVMVCIIYVFDVGLKL